MHIGAASHEDAALASLPYLEMVGAFLLGDSLSPRLIFIRLLLAR